MLAKTFGSPPFAGDADYMYVYICLISITCSFRDKKAALWPTANLIE